MVLPQVGLAPQGSTSRPQSRHARQGREALRPGDTQGGRTAVSEAIMRLLEQLRNNRHDCLCCQESSAFAQCDCISYSYFLLTFVLLLVGIVVTVFSFMDQDITDYYSNGHIWLVAGPVFISTGAVVLIKTIIYLRRKKLLQLLLTQRVLTREFQLHQTQQQLHIARDPSCLTLPPSYECVVDISVVPMGVHGGLTVIDTSAPPPTYEEALALLEQKHASTAEQPVLPPPVRPEDSEELQKEQNRGGGTYGVQNL
ncbi:unnamed protein product [Darwinula stevensoni]|uniref:Uncharacterized protein n=1 Tax=Darwinula stevensoni TaxID=69355 RepID=A0A7R9A096_9CRUS|nr:unnamed protein product [Darwinula stevensoni]CAG0880564.1 unnamed protein product [Darwinula stevensoni]